MSTPRDDALANAAVDKMMANQPAFEAIKEAFLFFWVPVKHLGARNFVALEARSRDYSPAELLALFLIGWLYGANPEYLAKDALAVWEGLLEETQVKGVVPERKRKG